MFLQAIDVWGVQKYGFSIHLLIAACLILVCFLYGVLHYIILRREDISGKRRGCFGPRHHIACVARHSPSTTSRDRLLDCENHSEEENSTMGLTDPHSVAVGLLIRTK